MTRRRMFQLGITGLVRLLLAGLAGGLSLPLAAAEPAGAPPTLVGVVFTITDPARELAFYRDVFGMTLATTVDHGTSREYILRFAGADGAPALLLQTGPEPDRRSEPTHGERFNRLVLRVTDMAAIVARLDRLGLAHEAPRSDPRGYRILHARDPEGFALEIIQATPPGPAATR